MVLETYLSLLLQDEIPLLSNVMLVGDKRKYLGALVTLKTMMSQDGAPTQELTPEAISKTRLTSLLFSCCFFHSSQGSDRWWTFIHVAPACYHEPSCLGILQEEGVSVRSVGEILRNPGKVNAVIQKGIDRVNERAASDILKVVKFEILPEDFSILGGELSPTFRLQRLVVTKKVLRP
jgi:long-chain-fatty-acid--CoA ligase ACSBG